MSNHTPLNTIVLKIDEIRKERDSRWASAYEQKKTELFNEGKIPGKKTPTGAILYGQIPENASDEIMAFADSVENTRNSNKEVQELVGIDSYYDLQKVSEIRSYAEMEFQLQINQKRKDSGENFQMSPEEFRLISIVRYHPEFAGRTLDDILAEQRRDIQKKSDTKTALRTVEERLFPGFLDTFEEGATKPNSVDEVMERHGRSKWGFYQWKFLKFCELDKEFRSAERAYKNALKLSPNCISIIVEDYHKEYDVWKRKAVSFVPNGNFERPDDIIRHNNAVFLSAVNSDRIFYYRLYEFNALDWKGKEHSRGTKIVRDEAELKTILEKETGLKVVDKWKKDAKDGGSVRLWLKGSVPLYDNVLKNMTYDVCVGCGKIFGNNSGNSTIDSIHNQKIVDAIRNAGQGYRTHDFCSERCGAEYHGIDYQALMVEDMEKRELSGYGTVSVVYRIHNKVTEKSYIGKTERNFLQRWGEHFGPTYTNAIFSDDLETHGIHSFSFEVVEQVRQSDIADRIESQIPNDTNLEYRHQARRRLFSQYILEREQYWIDFYDCVKNGYNCRDNFKKT